MQYQYIDNGYSVLVKIGITFLRATFAKEIMLILAIGRISGVGVIFMLLPLLAATVQKANDQSTDA